MKYNKIYIYIRQTSHNKISPTRVPWFDYEKSFKNLLDTINWALCDLTVCFDGSHLEYDSHFTKKYQSINNFRVVLIDTKSFTGKSYEPNCGSSKSGALTTKIIKNDRLPENSLIYVLENDYIHRNYWAEAALDLFNGYISDNHYISLYDHLDKYIFTRPEAIDHWGMYRDLKSKIILSSHCHWRYVPLICSSWIFPKRLLDRDYDLLSIGISDNTGCNEFNKRDGTQFLTPIPSFATHSESWFLAPYIDWIKILQETKIF